MKRRELVLAASAAAILPTAHAAEVYPSRPVKVIVPFPPSSGSDLICRVVDQELQERLGQPFVVDNKPGAQTVIGSDVVARSAPDGYTLLGTAVSFAATRGLFKKLPFDPVADFTPISRIATTPQVLVVRHEFPASTAAEFVALAKRQSKPFSAGYGSASSQVCLAQLQSLASIPLTQVPYRGIPLAVNDLLAGTLDLTFASLGEASAQVKGGRLKVVGVSSATRDPLAPEWPALAETIPGFDIQAWNAYFAPKGTPMEIAQKLHDTIVAALAKPEVQASFASIGFSPAPLGPREMASFVPAEVTRWTRLIREAGIEPE